MTKFKRILLKLSGESLMGEKGHGIDEKRLGEYAAQIKEIHDMGVQIGIVIGGGNIFRGLSGASKGFDRVKGDQMGMLATAINSLALSSALTAIGVKTRVLTAIRMEPIGETDSLTFLLLITIRFRLQQLQFTTLLQSASGGMKKRTAQKLLFTKMQKLSVSKKTGQKQKNTARQILLRNLPRKFLQPAQRQTLCG